MPLYEYECENCAHRYEIIQKFSDPPPDTCPSCGKGPLRRLLSSPAIQFKGTGWYITDYARKGKSDGGSKGSSSGSSEKSDKSEKTDKSDAGSSTPAASSSDKSPSKSGTTTEKK